MNRQTKFRGKNKTGQWVYGSLVTHPTGKQFIIRYATTGDPEWHEVDRDTVGEWTGLRDCNDKPIFEGDVIEIISYWTHPAGKEMARTQAVVEFSAGKFEAAHGSGLYDIANFLEDVTIISNDHNLKKETKL